MDQSPMRRGKPCWYLNVRTVFCALCASTLNAVHLQKGVGLIAINDSFLIESTIYKILKKYFKSDPYYINVVELFHEVCDTTKASVVILMLRLLFY